MSRKDRERPDPSVFEKDRIPAGRAEDGGSRPPVDRLTSPQGGRSGRERKLYWIRGRQGEKDALIFDPGYAGGDVHVYLHAESIPSERIKQEVLAMLKIEKLPDYPGFNPVAAWARGKGVTLEWTIGR